MSPLLLFLMALSSAQLVQEPLPYRMDALEPHMSARTLELHYGKHHASYVSKANAVLPEGLTNANVTSLLSSLPRDQSLFNNVAQHFNHAFFWRCLAPSGGGSPSGALLAEITRDFGGLSQFRAQFAGAAAANFGSGWTWLTRVVGRTHLEIENTSNANLPKNLPVLTLDVWEHGTVYFINSCLNDF